MEVESITVSVDAAKVERILENLLSNAIRHTPDGTRIWIRGFGQDGGVMLIVEDEGHGIPHDLHEAVFEPFRQAPGSSSGHSPGVGVGLSLVRRFAELHGGRAWLEDREGGGSSFHVFLPGGYCPSCRRRYGDARGVRVRARRSRVHRRSRIPSTRRCVSRRPIWYHEPTDHWLVSRYADVNALLRDRRFGRTYHHVATHAEMGRPEEPDWHGPFWHLIRSGILDMEPPDHTRVRALVSKAFTPRMVEGMREPDPTA